MGDFLAVAAPRGIVGAAEEINDLSPLPPPIRGSRNDLCSRASRNSNEEFLPAFHPANEAGSILAQFPQSDCLHPRNCSTYATDEHRSRKRWGHQRRSAPRIVPVLPCPGPSINTYELMDGALLRHSRPEPRADGPSHLHDVPIQRDTDELNLCHRQRAAFGLHR